MVRRLNVTANHVIREEEADKKVISDSLTCFQIFWKLIIIRKKIYS